jgi:hypothetical protein
MGSDWCFIVILAATSVDVERTFSKGRILLSHLRNRLSVESMRALICLGVWSSLGYVRDSDVRAETLQPAIEREETLDELRNGWDAITFTSS